MLGRARRSLFTPVHFLAQHASDKQEKLEASRAMARRCERGETTDFDRLQVRTLILPSVISIMDKFGFDDADGEQPAHGTSVLRKPARAVMMVNALSTNTPRREGLSTEGESEEAVPLAGAMSAAAALTLERKLDALLVAVAQSHAEQRALRRQLERLEARSGSGTTLAWEDAVAES